MSAPPPARVPVLVAGGGPSGLAAAIELGRRGIEVLVVELRTSRDPLRPRAGRRACARRSIGDARRSVPLMVGHLTDLGLPERYSAGLLLV